MSILTQQKFLLKPSNHAIKTHPITPFSNQIHCSIITPTKSNSTQSRLVIEPSSVTSSAPRPNDPSLKSTWTHRAWLASGCTTVLIALTKSLTTSTGSHTWVEPVLSGLAGYILSDLGSGVYHWGIDNYGGAQTPIFGPQIEAFQGHHKWPWTITKRQFANNLHSLARVITFTVLPMDLLLHDPVQLAFIGSFSGCIMFSQQFHAWAHATKSKLPPFVVALQDVGVLVSRLQHGEHHRSPYNVNYCIVSGIWNNVLDENKVFEALEMVLFFWLGVRPRSWSEPSLEWAEDDVTLSSLTK
ncbi:hypothetical protein vseg_007463 [Gypsophila vaccaria]